MFDWIPIKRYYDVYYLLELYFLILLLMLNIKYGIYKNISISTSKLFGYILLIFSLLYIGLRPISGRFIDMTTYHGIFQNFQTLSSFPIDITTDKLFWFYMYVISLAFNSQMFFFITACLYILPMYWVSRANFKKLWFYCFFLFISSFSFFNYGTNGIRNGLAASVFLMAFSTNRKLLQFFWLIVAYFIHGSMLLPAIAFLLASYYHNTNRLILFWLIAIPVSLVFGDNLQTIFATLSTDDRTGYLTAGSDNEYAYLSGFRWDFLLYSGSAIFLGWYAKSRLNITSKKYDIIFGTYIISNLIWILVINASFSNRFAYLSWFMMPLVVSYPFLINQPDKPREKMIMLITLGYFFFTFFMNFIYYR